MFRTLLIPLLLLPLLAGCAGGPNANKVSYNPRAAEANAELGKGYMQRGDNMIALDKFKRALEFDPKSANAHHYLAELYRRLDKAKEAEEHYKMAIEYGVNDSALLNNYGVYLCGERRLEEAMIQFNKVLKDPGYRFPEQIYENLGLCMAQNGQIEDAEKNLRKALTINPKLSKALFELAKISLQQDKFFSARAFINRFTEISEPSAESLWLAIEIESKLKDQKAVNSYGEQLLGKFPLSEEAEKYHRLNVR